MVTTLFLTLAIFGGVMAIMAVGVVFAGKSLRGSCGGVGDCHCTEDGVPPESCSRVVVQSSESSILP
jgi:hypothetical protein